MDEETIKKNWATIDGRMAALEVWMTYMSEQQLTSLGKQVEILALQKTILAATGTQMDPEQPPLPNPDAISALFQQIHAQELKTVEDQLSAIRKRLFGPAPEGTN